MANALIVIYLAVFCAFGGLMYEFGYVAGHLDGVSDLYQSVMKRK